MPMVNRISSEDEIIARTLRSIPACAERRRLYVKFQKTDYWKRLKGRLWYLAGKTCERCPTTESLRMHHKTYDRIGMEEESDVLLLCAECHEIEHTIGRVVRVGQKTR